MNQFQKVLQVADLSSVVLTTSVGFTADSSRVLGVQAVYTSTTFSGSLTLQFSLDNANWTDFVTATSITNASGNVHWNVASTATAATSNVDPLYWRVLVTRSSGTLTTCKIYFGYLGR